MKSYYKNQRLKVNKQSDAALNILGIALVFAFCLLLIHWCQPVDVSFVASKITYVR